MVPGDWSLGAIGGEHKSGYFRLDDEEMSRLEVKWSEGQAVDLGTTLDKYARGLTRKARRSRTPVSFERDTRLLGRRAKPDKRLSCFALRADQQAQGIIWVCRTCGRTVIAQVLGAPGERIEELARAVFTSMEDHAQEGFETWALFDFICKAPKDYALEGQKLLAGYLELNFKHGKRRLKFTRWGLAERILQGEGVAHWAELENVKRRDASWESQPREVHGHAGIELRGRAKGVPARLQRVFRGALGLVAGDEFGLAAWHCPQVNRLYTVEALYQPGADMLPQLVSEVQCHG